MNLKADLTALCVIAICIGLGSAQTLSPNNTLRCRACAGATTLSDCNHLATCDSTLEDCYLDQIVTDQLTVVYNGGCRSKQVCSLSGGKRSTACSRCCNFEDDCNKRLCGIKDDTLTTNQCYSCDHRDSEQSEVTDPLKCVTLDTCQQNEVCYATQSDIAGRDTFFYGCLSKLRCQFLMQSAFEDYKVCVLNATQPIGVTWLEYCGNAHTRSTSLCHSCCADNACNYGACNEINERIFNLAMLGKFDMKTLKTV